MIWMVCDSSDVYVCVCAELLQVFDYFRVQFFTCAESKTRRNGEHNFVVNLFLSFSSCIHSPLLSRVRDGQFFIIK